MDHHAAVTGSPPAAPPAANSPWADARLTRGAPADTPLAGLRVVELHAIGPVPFAARLLAELGAQVVRVSPPVDPGLGLAVAPEFDVLNHGKQALALDL